MRTDRNPQRSWTGLSIATLLVLVPIYLDTVPAFCDEGIQSAQLIPLIERNFPSVIGRIDQPPLPDPVQAIIYEDRVFDRDLKRRLNNEDVLIIRNCVFNGCKLALRGQGTAYIEDCTFNAPPTVGISIMIDGYVEIDSISIYGTGTAPDGKLYSGLAIYGMGQGGVISNLKVMGFPGNGVLLEASDPIVGVELYDIDVSNCGGGIWFFNARECWLDGFYGYNSNYRLRGENDAPRVFPCVRDGRLVDGARVQGDTEFNDVVCE
ncbi:right-handed parallel beta-helix repeat-containing protein [Thermodesulfobacteriota bacterium]